MVSFLVCLVHHAAVVPLGLYYLFLDSSRDEAGLKAVDYAAEYAWFVPWIFGYFIADTMAYAVPLALGGKYEYMFHHILGLGLIVTVIYIEDSIILKLCPHMLICELSSILFSVAYVLRLNGYRDSMIVTVLELAFAFFFFLTRNVNLSMILWSVNDIMAAKYTACWVIMVLVLILQFFWLSKIIASLFKKASSKDESRKNKNK